MLMSHAGIPDPGFSIGDQVRCVDARPRRDALPKERKLLSWLRPGRVYQVREIGLPFRAIHLEGDGLTWTEGWNHERFVKVEA